MKKGYAHIWQGLYCVRTRSWKQFSKEGNGWMMIRCTAESVHAAAAYLSEKTIAKFTAVPVLKPAGLKKSGSVNGMQDGKRGDSPHSEWKIIEISKAEKAIERRYRGGMIQASGWGILNADIALKIKEIEI